jgi:lysophospholipase L1-like esterase
MVMPIDRRSFVALCASVAMGGLAACTTNSPSDAAPGGPRDVGGDGAAAPGERLPIASVVVLGDSISRATDEEYHATFAKAGISDVRVEAQVGRRIEVGNGKGAVPLSGVRTLFGLLAEKVSPDAWVIELGTNDIGSYADAAAYAGLIDQILGMLPADVPLVWVNAYRPQYVDHTNMFNMVLQQRISDRANATVADWFTVASSPDQNVLRSDDLHPNTNGQAVLSMLVLQALQRL